MYEIERDNEGGIPDISPRELRMRLPEEFIMRAIFCCRQEVRGLLLPEQQQDELAVANALEQRTHYLPLDAGDMSLYCDGSERAFIHYWTATPQDRLNGTQRLALSFYRDGRYASARLSSEVIGADGGMTWALIRHLSPTSDPQRAHLQLERTFARLCDLGQSMRCALNQTLDAEFDSPASDDEVPAPLGAMGQSL